LESSPHQRLLPRWVFYTLSGVLPFATLFLRLGLEVTFGDRPLLILFVFPIIVSAHFGGLGPGLVSTLLSAGLVDYFMIPPIHSLRILQPHDLLQWLMLIACGVLISLFNEALHRARGREAASLTLQASAMERYKLLLDSAADAIFIQGPQGRMLEVNRTACERLGYSRSEMLSLSPGEFDSPEFAALIPERIEVILRQGNLVCESVHVTRDGRFIPVELNARLIEFEGQPAIMTVARDITERKQVEEILRESERKNKFLADIIRLGSQPVGVGYPDGRLGLVNRAYEELTGYRFEELQSIDWDRVLTPTEWQPLERAKLEELQNTNKPVLYEKEYIRKDGTRVPVELLVHLARTPDGKPEYYYSYVTDITERNRSLKELLNREHYLRTILETTVDGFWVVDSRGRFIEVNAAYCRMSGYTREELLNLGVPDIESIENPAETEARIRYIKEQGSQTFESRHRRKDGGTFEVQVSVTYLGADTGHLICFCRDITKRKREEEEREKLRVQLAQAQKMESVGRLAGGVAHDFNNMLGIMIANTQLASMEIEPESPISSYLKEILRAGSGAADTVRQLMGFARKQIISPKSLDLNETIAGMVKMLRRLIREDIDLQWIPGDGIGRVRMDPAQINQILANLVVNSRDAIRDSGVITVETSNVSLDAGYCRAAEGCLPGDYVLLTVSDNGSGMNKTVLDQVFEPFFTTKEIGKGTGLGMATVYGIVTQNKGHITIYSEPGRGTTVRIYFPNLLDSPTLKSDGTEEQGMTTGSETVLLVEDQEQLLNVTRSILTKLGYSVLAALSPKQAIDLAESHDGEIHLLLTDVIMPGMNGTELAEQLLRRRKNLKVLYMSGYTAETIGRHAVLDGKSYLIEKPFLSQKLAEKVREVMDQK
jgi:two-component system, cell cycle sensor histidine kinase and response regulator CckA